MTTLFLKILIFLKRKKKERKENSKIYYMIKLGFDLLKGEPYFAFHGLFGINALAFSGPIALELCFPDVTYSTF